MNDKAYKFSTRDSTEFTVGDGSALPEVTAEDNGDVLTVVDGEWAKATPSGGGVLIVHVDTTTWTLDKTWQEIYDAGFSVIQMEDEFGWLFSVNQEDGSFVVAYFVYGNEAPVTFIASSADGYPVYTE